jgi:hypothetical protein
MSPARVCARPAASRRPYADGGWLGTEQVAYARCRRRCRGLRSLSSDPGLLSAVAAEGEGRGDDVRVSGILLARLRGVRRFVPAATVLDVGRDKRWTTGARHIGLGAWVSLGSWLDVPRGTRQSANTEASWSMFHVEHSSSDVWEQGVVAGASGDIGSKQETGQNRLPVACCGWMRSSGLSPAASAKEPTVRRRRRRMADSRRLCRITHTRQAR